MIGHIRGPPRRLRCGHLDDAGPDGPDVAGPAVAVSPQNLRRHEGDGALQLPLELAGNGRLGGQEGGGAEVGDAQVVAGGVHEQVGTYRQGQLLRETVVLM